MINSNDKEPGVNEVYCTTSTDAIVMQDLVTKSLKRPNVVKIEGLNYTAYNGVEYIVESKLGTYTEFEHIILDAISNNNVVLLQNIYDMYNRDEQGVSRFLLRYAIVPK